MKRNRLILETNAIIELLGLKYKGLANIFSDKFGIINAMLKREELSKYNIFMYQCLTANATKLFNLDREVSSGGLGVNENEKYAMIGCLAEAIERYCISYMPKKELVYCKKEDLPKNRTFSEFHLYSEKQYKTNNNFANPNSDNVHWIKIKSINNNDWKYWPASLIYIPFNISLPVAETTTTGTAAGFTTNECIKSGLLELIERDALMINFMQKLNPPEIDTDTINDEANKNLLKKIKKDYNVKIYSLYTDTGVPVILSIIWKKKIRGVHYGIGACAALDSDMAINKSLKECLFTNFYSKNILDLRKSNKDDITALYEHFLYYQRDNFNKLLFQSKKIKYKRNKIKFEDVVANLKRSNIDIYYKELTTPDVQSTKIKVLKVIAPGLIDLNKSHILPRLNAERFWDVPKKLGLKVNEKLSEYPHPFP